MDWITGLRAFVGVVDNGGFAAAARAMNLSRSAVHKHVTQLEDRLGAQLLRRSTRQVSPTETGNAFYTRCLQILAELDSAITSVTELQEDASGSLRINAPMSLGMRCVATVAAQYMAANPRVLVELALNDRFIDPIEEGFDVSIRVSEPHSSTSLVSREIAVVQRWVCASPEYLARAGTPDTPAALKQHRCLHYGYQASGASWRLRGATGEVSVPVSCAMWSNNGEVLLAAARQHQGVVLLPDFIVSDAVDGGELQVILAEYEPAPLSLQALYPRHRHLSGKVRGFVELLAAELGEPELAA